jgi:ankyrin repeat protein
MSHRATCVSYSARRGTMNRMSDAADGSPPPAAPRDEAMEELATRLFDMARAGDAGRLTAYLEAGTPPNLANQQGDTLLMLAAYHGHAAAVAALLAAGADPDRLNDKGQSPLAGAVFRGEDEVVRALVAAGADPDAGQPTARATARMFGRDDLLAALDR